MSAIKKITNVPDLKDSNGLWLKSYYPDPSVRCVTRSEVVWSGIQSRGRIGGRRQDVYRTYTGCTNDFKDYQYFTDWCQDQYGYMSQEPSGRFWALDKDLLSLDNLSYNEDSCIFVPGRINNLITNSAASRGDYPLGVSLYKRTGRYRAYIGKDAKHLGYFSSPEEAHKAWQKAKIERIENILETDSEVLNHKKLCAALERIVQHIRYEHDNNLETAL